MGSVQYDVSVTITGIIRDTYKEKTYQEQGT